MNPYHTLTDEQLAEWHQLTTKVDRLTADLAESRKATESVQARAEQERQTLTAELRRRGDRIAELTMKEIHSMSAVRSTSGALIETLKALKALHDLVMQGQVANKQAQWPGEVFRAVEAAHDALRKYDIPF